MNAHNEEEDDEEEDETLSRMETDITDEEMARRCESQSSQRDVIWEMSNIHSRFCERKTLTYLFFLSDMKVWLGA